MSETRRGSQARVLVIGLDGGTFALLDGWMARGLMPNLQRMTGAGSRAVLRSVMPPVTAPAWTSFATGVRPGKHGVFDFAKRQPDSPARRVISSRDVRAPTLWDILADAGLRVGLINVPVTYPLSDRTSFGISDMLTPSTEVQFTNPPSLYEELRPQLGEYIIDAPPNHLQGRKAIAPFLEALEKCTRQRAKYTAHLLRTREWDFSMVVFVGTDRLQHVLWDTLSGDFKLYPATAELQQYKERAERFVSLLDGSIGDIVAACPEETDVFFVSDHGFGPLLRKFRVNKWLAQQGLLTPSRRRGRLGRLVASADVLRLRHRIARLLARGKRSGARPFWRWINWTRTRAYTSSITEMGIYVNLKGREPNGIVAPGDEYEQVRDAILEGLRSLRHPETGQPLLTMAGRREELFEGPHIDDAPDVVYTLEDGACTVDLRLEGPLFERATWRAGTGMHRFDGILIACGPNIQRGKRLPEAEIIDVAPTVLELFRIPIPSDMEGRVVHGLLTQAARRAAAESEKEGKQPSPDEDRPGPGRPDDSPYSEEEARQVEERLEGLGYL
jgi:predicted AlkP superfamily phosphohydrolase/phosphomutase